VVTHRRDRAPHGPAALPAHTAGCQTDRVVPDRERKQMVAQGSQPDQKQEQLGADSNAKFSHHVLMWIGNVKDRPAGMTHLRKSMSATHIGSTSSARESGGASESSGDCR
jgi:hypothetical protein